MRVASLRIHPIKSGAIEHVQSLNVSPAGPDGDRRWMLVDEADRFVTQRTVPKLALLTCDVVGDTLVLSSPNGLDRLPVVLSGERVDAVIWRDTVSVALADDATNARISAWLGRPVRLVKHDDRSCRRTNPEWSSGGPVALPDGYPLLVATTASLAALNDDILASGSEPVTIDRFRPNIVVEGSRPWAEDGWASIEIGGVILDLVKPCVRCAITTVDQTRGERASEEPMATLRRVRRSAGPRLPGALFAWNAVSRGTGRIAVGDAVTVLSERPRWPIAPVA